MNRANWSGLNHNICQTVTETSCGATKMNNEQNFEFGKFTGVEKNEQSKTKDAALRQTSPKVSFPEQKLTPLPKLNNNYSTKQIIMRYYNNVSWKLQYIFYLKGKAQHTPDSNILTKQHQLRTEM